VHKLHRAGMTPGLPASRRRSCCSPRNASKLAPSFKAPRWTRMPSAGVSPRARRWMAPRSPDSSTPTVTPRGTSNSTATAPALRPLLVGRRRGARRALRRHLAAPGAACRPLDRAPRAASPHPGAARPL